MKQVNWMIPDDAGEKLKKDGFFFDENIIIDNDLIEINKEINEWKYTPAINGYGCLHHDHDALLQNLSLYSPAALKMALSESLINFMEKHYGEKVILSKIEYRRTLVSKPKMPLHSDNSKAVLIFIYLSGASKSLGATATIPGTHIKGISLNEGYYQIPEHVERDHGLAEIAVEGRPGTCLFFDANIWHSRHESTQPGREIIWISYIPFSARNDTANLVFSRRSLIGLNNRQLDVLALRVEDLGNKFSEDFRLSKLQQNDSLRLLPGKFIIRALLNNIYMDIRQSIPYPIKIIIKKIIGIKNKKVNIKIRD